MRSKREQRQADAFWGKVWAVAFLVALLWFAWKQTQPQPTLQDYQREVYEHLARQ